MAALTNYAENKLIDAIFRGQSLGAPATWYIGLHTAARAEDGSAAEVSGGSYARVAVTASLANFAGTQSSGSTTASSGTGGTTSNNGTITFPTSSAAWGTVQSVGFWDASSGGNCWAQYDLTSSLNVSGSGFTVSFSAAQLTFQIDN